jgi:hypothetical protein
LTQEHYELSVYSDDRVNTQTIIKAFADIKQAFPSLPRGFYDILDDRVKANKFTNQRLKDCVAFVIDNCMYPTPTIANFISYDKTVKLFKYEDILNMADKFGADTWHDYKSIQLQGMSKKVWIHINDIEKYNIHDTD